jgi:hypothetical protein
LLAVQADAAQITSFQRATVEVPVYSDPDAFNLSHSTQPTTEPPIASMPVGTEFGIAGFKVNKNHVNVDRVVFLSESGECQTGWAKSNGLYLEKVRDPTPGTDDIKAKCLSRPIEHAPKASGVTEAASGESKGSFGRAFSSTLQHATFKGVMVFASVVAIMLITSYVRVKVTARRFYRSNLGFQTFKTFTQSRMIPFIENSVVLAATITQFAVVIGYLIYLAKA